MTVRFFSFNDKKIVQFCKMGLLTGVFIVQIAKIYDIINAKEKSSCNAGKRAAKQYKGEGL